MFSLNRLVALGTPLFATAAAAISHLCLTRFGYHVSPDALVPVETTVAISAGAAALKWLHGWQRQEAHEHALSEEAQRHQNALAETKAVAASVQPKVSSK